MNYQLHDKFGEIPNSIEPDSIVLNYIGEIDGESDYKTFFGYVFNVKYFEGNGHLTKCNEWKAKTTLDSFSYPEFKGENVSVKVLCVDKTSYLILSVNLTSVPTGITETISDDDENDDDKMNDVKDKNASDKKKLPLAAIIGIAVGGAVIIVVVIVVVVVVVRKKKKAGVMNDNEVSP